MRKAQKQQAEELVRQMEEAHDQIKKFIEQGSILSAMELLEECQNGGITLGNLIENTEGEGHPTVSLLEEYCELTYQVHENLAVDKDISTNKIYKLLRQKLIKVSNSLKNDIRIRIEVVFFPYKASMWDSLESVYLAAKEDSDCDAYCVPIPYYDLKPDHSFGQVHYEGGAYPKDIEITDWQSYNFEERKPDIIYTHNPYDDWNLVTSIHPRYYSSNLKKYTDCLVYAPYYSTFGSMSEAQKTCPVYFNADYIVIQTPEFRDFFDERLPDSKFLPFGSPKFDRIIKKCQNPPEASLEWKRKMAGCKVYFYNTSIGGMLANTEGFLKKMRYVFDSFRGRDNACILWRPHPLLESSFDSMRPQYKAEYEELKRYFIENDIGIYDTTPDLADSIAWSDAYIGDLGTSVTSLFGISGKPVFILNNQINSFPKEGDWRKEKIMLIYDYQKNDRYYVSTNNQLWFAEKNDYHYRFYMDLQNGYSGGSYYIKALEIGDKIYVLPHNARHILVIKDKKIKKIELRNAMKGRGAFSYYWYNKKYIFMFPFKYPFFVRFDIETETVEYVNGIQQFMIKNINGQWQSGGVCQYGNELVVSSPADNRFIFIDMATLKMREVSSGSKSNLGTGSIVPDGDGLWLMPLNGVTICYWNPKTKKIREYNGLPSNFKLDKGQNGIECNEIPFVNLAVSQENGNDTVILAPLGGNMYVSLNRESGEMEEWKLPAEYEIHGKKEHFLLDGAGAFITEYSSQGKPNHKIWYTSERKLFDINIVTKELKEIEIEFDYEEVKAHQTGFSELSEWEQYCLCEDAFHTLDDFLDGSIVGNQFNREDQLKAFLKVNVSPDGFCGKKVHEYVKGQIV